jgi:hypothetical protein
LFSKKDKKNLTFESQEVIAISAFLSEQAKGLRVQLQIPEYKHGKRAMAKGT